MKTKNTKEPILQDVIEKLEDMKRRLRQTQLRNEETVLADVGKEDLVVNHEKRIASLEAWREAVSGMAGA